MAETAVPNWHERAQSHRIDPRPVIGGQRLESRATATLALVSPVTGEVRYSVPCGNSADIDAAVGAARAAFDGGPWRSVGPMGRRAMLLRFAELIEQRAADLALDDCGDVGKPISAALGEMPIAAGFIRYYAEAIDKVYGQVAPQASDVVELIAREPRGVVGIIVPWNFPTINATLKLGPALAAGNCVVLKPSELGPASALRLAELALEAGLPPGVLNVVTGGREAGQALVTHPGVELIAFTGSTATGRQIMRAIGETRLKPVQLECGGKSPQIVFADARELDLDAVAATIVGEVLWNQGQVCIARTRLLIQDEIYADLLDRCAKVCARYVAGDPLDSATSFGPLVNKAQQTKVNHYIESGVADGARQLFGARDFKLPAQGCYVAPTLFADVKPSAKIAREEIFGPVVAAMRFKDENEAILLANDSDYGLAATVWTTRLKRGHRMAAALRSGWIKVMASTAPSIGAPYAHSFEPYGQSGFGVEGGLAGLQSYSVQKSVQYLLGMD